MHRQATAIRNNSKKLKRVLYALYAILFVLCSSADAQQIGKVPRIGFLDPSTAAGSAVLVNTQSEELRELGPIQGKNIVFEYRFAEQKLERSA